jgi:hypothetical protein
MNVDDKERLRAIAIQFREDAVNDRWTLVPMLESSTAEQHGKLTRDGYVMHIVAATYPQKDGSINYDSRITIWGPDKLQIRLTSAIYSWDEIQAGLRSCCLCHAEDVDTGQYGFAGRCCKSCETRLRKAPQPTAGFYLDDLFLKSLRR